MIQDFTLDYFKTVLLRTVPAAPKLILATWVRKSLSLPQLSLGASSPGLCAQVFGSALEPGMEAASWEPSGQADVLEPGAVAGRSGMPVIQ